jgi:hypothetical protein
MPQTPPEAWFVQFDELPKAAVRRVRLLPQVKLEARGALIYR